MKIRELSYLAITIFFVTCINAASESLDSDSVSVDQVSESVQSDTVATQQLEEVTTAPDQVSATVEQTNANANNEIKNEDIPQKPLGVREAEGKVIGEE